MSSTSFERVEPAELTAARGRVRAVGAELGRARRTLADLVKRPDADPVAVGILAVAWTATRKPPTSRSVATLDTVETAMALLRHRTPYEELAVDFRLAVRAYYEAKASGGAYRWSVDNRLGHVDDAVGALDRFRATADRLGLPVARPTGTR